MELYMLDTDICSYVMKRTHPRLLQKLRTVDIEQIAISVVTEAELLYGIKLSAKPSLAREAFEGFIKHVSVLPWGRDAGEHYADIRANLHKRGQMIRRQRFDDRRTRTLSWSDSCYKQRAGIPSCERSKCRELVSLRRIY